MDFPPLYKEKRVWKISVDGKEITRSYGMDGGKLQVKESKGSENIARKLWESQKNKGYEERVHVEFAPMLPHPYNMFQRHLPDHIFLQPKYDGIRLFVKRNERRQIVLTTRRGEELEGFDNIRKKFTEILTTTDVIVDGEVYDPTRSFEELCEDFKKGNDSTMQYHVYDCYWEATPLMEYCMRRYLMEIMLSGTYMEIDRIGFVETKKKRKEKVKKKFDFCALDRWEGVVVRVPKCIYTPGKRNKGFLELKHPKNKEYEICERGPTTWTCKTEQGQKFDVDPPPNAKEGNWVSVRFKEYTDEGVPRAPVVVSLRTIL